MPSYQKIEKIKEKKEEEKEVESRPVICNHGWLGYPATGYDPIAS